jgi:hypothetical protein
MSSNHVHSYSSDSSYDDGHTHRLSGTTGYGLFSGYSHVHHYRGVTSFENAHVHYYEGTSGPAVSLASGGHAHQYFGLTSVDGQHVHEYHAKTDRENVGNFFK